MAESLDIICINHISVTKAGILGVVDELEWIIHFLIEKGSVFSLHHTWTSAPWIIFMCFFVCIYLSPSDYLVVQAEGVVSVFLTSPHHRRSWHVPDLVLWKHCWSLTMLWWFYQQLWHGSLMSLPFGSFTRWNLVFMLALLRFICSSRLRKMK